MLKPSKIILCLCFAVLTLFLSPKCFAIVDVGLHKVKVVVKGTRRSFYEYIPSHYDKTTKLPLVMVFHGSNANGKTIMKYTDFNKFAEKYNFIAVYPNKKGLFDWSLQVVANNKELDFVNELLNYFEKNYNIDTNRVYSTGYSSGADISNMIACAMPDKFAAIAGTSSNMFKRYAVACNQTNRPISVFMINGTADRLAPFAGDGKDKLSVDNSLLFWENHDKCDLSKEKVVVFKNSDPKTSAKFSTVLGCLDDSEVSSLKINGGGHTWPAGVRRFPILEFFAGPTNYDVSASQMIVDFFSRHNLH